MVGHCECSNELSGYSAREYGGFVRFKPLRKAVSTEDETPYRSQ